jgi:DNA-binding IclR family transcriptional regulator
VERLHEELELARKQGCALDNEEETLGIKCVGVAIRDSGGRPVGALSISCPSIEMNEEEISKYVNLLNFTSLTFAQSKWNDFFPVQFL